MSGQNSFLLHVLDTRKHITTTAKLTIPMKAANGTSSLTGPLIVPMIT